MGAWRYVGESIGNQPYLDQYHSESTHSSTHIPHASWHRAEYHGAEVQVDEPRIISA